MTGTNLKSSGSLKSGASLKSSRSLKPVASLKAVAHFKSGASLKPVANFKSGVSLRSVFWVKCIKLVIISNLIAQYNLRNFTLLDIRVHIILHFVSLSVNNARIPNTRNLSGGLYCNPNIWCHCCNSWMGSSVLHSWRTFHHLVLPVGLLCNG